MASSFVWRAVFISKISDKVIDRAADAAIDAAIDFARTLRRSLPARAPPKVADEISAFAWTSSAHIVIVFPRGYESNTDSGMLKLLAELSERCARTHQVVVDAKAELVSVGLAGDGLGIGLDAVMLNFRDLACLAFDSREERFYKDFLNSAVRVPEVTDLDGPFRYKIAEEAEAKWQDLAKKIPAILIRYVNDKKIETTFKLNPDRVAAELGAGYHSGARTLSAKLFDLASNQRLPLYALFDAMLAADVTAIPAIREIARNFKKDSAFFRPVWTDSQLLDVGRLTYSHDLLARYPEKVPEPPQAPPFEVPAAAAAGTPSGKDEDMDITEGDVST